MRVLFFMITLKVWMMAVLISDSRAISVSCHQTRQTEQQEWRPDKGVLSEPEALQP